MKRIVFVLLFITLCIGCQTDRESHPKTNHEEEQSIINLENKENVSNTTIANHLAKLATNVPKVNRATAIIAGPFAVVGIDVDGQLDRSRVGTIKYSVSEALYHDPYGKTAIVIADADVTDRLQGMNKKIKQGYPIQGIIDELAMIIGRYMPEFPTPDEQPEKHLNHEQHHEENELNDIQKEHSHD